MMHRFFAFCLASLAAPLVTAQERIPAHLLLVPSKRPPIQQSAEQAVFSVQRAAVRSIAQLPVSQIEISDFPISPTETGLLRLERTASAVDGQTEWWIGVRAPRDGKPAELRPLSPPVQYMFSGSIANEPNTHVWLSIVDGELFALLKRGDGRIIELAPILSSEHTTNEHLLRIVSADSTFQWFCGTAELPDYSHKLADLAKHPPTIQQFSPLLQARVAVETTTSLYQRLGRSQQRVAAYIAALFSMVSKIYEDEINVRLVLSWVLIWAEPPDGDEDPYQNDTDIAALLNEASRYWNNNWTFVDRDVVHVLTAPSSTDVGGIARLATLCSRNSAYSVSGIRGTFTYPTAAYTWDVFVVAHEIGHVFGAPHTHDCYWAPPLDTCVTKTGNPPIPDACYQSPIQPRPSWNGGSIMSYCHLVQQTVAMTFRERVAFLIRNNRASNCLRQPTQATLLLQHPIGNQQFTGGTSIPIRWTSAQVQTVTIEYSTDSLQTWQPIISGVAAAQRSYNWQAPAQRIPAVWIRIIDPTNPTVGDTTKASISIVVPEVRLLSPQGGERLGFGERFSISWTQTLVTTVRVLVSLNGGRQWDTLSASTTGQSLQWTVPNVATTEALIRIESTADPRILSQSAPFAIGASTIQIITPNGGEEWATGTQQQIRWSSDFLSRVRIDYSIDAGRNWRLVALNYDATTQSFTWTIPNTPTDSAVVRIRSSFNTAIVTQSAGPFRIVRNNGTLSLPQSPTMPNIEVLSNPSNGEFLLLRLSGTSAHSGSAAVAIYNTLGQRLSQADERWLSADEHVLALRLPPSLPNGAYFLSIEVGTQRVFLPFLIAR
ncbi:MAG: zinc-dependent metalloprotease [Bacteroidota bacterium]|nr:zinc-dependent metalloprotease [Bacteroidota bacterium]